MRFQIPSSVGLLSVTLAGSGCTAYQFAEAFEKVCKAQCECEPQTDNWNNVNNCKKACAGYSQAQKAQLKDHFEDEEPCDDAAKLSKDIKDCAKKSCSKIQECVSELYADIAECLGYDYSYATEEPDSYRAHAIRRALNQQMLYGPIPLNCAEEDEQALLCEESLVVVVSE